MPKQKEERISNLLGQLRESNKIDNTHPDRSWRTHKNQGIGNSSYSWYGDELPSKSSSRDQECNDFYHWSPRNTNKEHNLHKQKGFERSDAASRLWSNDKDELIYSTSAEEMDERHSMDIADVKDEADSLFSVDECYESRNSILSGT